MGKSNFKGIYRKIKSEGTGQISCKISAFSDDYVPGKNYAGIIIYGIKGKTQWFNEDGEASGYKGRSFYIIMKCTENYEVGAENGCGIVHDYPIKLVLGSVLERNEVLCGGFAWLDRVLKYNSVWLNQYNQMDLDGVSGSGRSDGSKELSNPEKQLVKYCFEQYQKHGPNATFSITADMDRALSN